ncbi:uncharacterized protein YmaD-like [Oscarella lobularis]|uniref:uncharacterized protein YmaD-like n=1 Tax=Oscarella lobularis TaxID=121494 RepID=UPI003313ED03
MGSKQTKTATINEVTATTTTPPPKPKHIAEFEIEALGAGFHTDCTVGKTGDFTVKVAEPKEKGGSGEGPNPMEYLLVSLTTCHQETASLIAMERGIEKWGPIKFKTEFELNTDGFLGLHNDDGGLTAPQVFRRVVLNADVDGDVDQATIDDILFAVKQRCPVRSLFQAAGVQVEGKWQKKIDCV